MGIIFKIIKMSLIIVAIIFVIPVNADVTGLKYDYVINYYKDSVDKENLIETIRGRDIFGKEINVDISYKVPDGYKYLGDELLFKIDKSDNEINVIYSKRGNLSYCINYFYDGIVAINNTDCFYGQPFGKEVTSFVDKPKDGYVFDRFDSITVLDIEENIMNVYYKSASIEDIEPPNTSITYNNIISNLINFLKKIIRSIY